MMQIYCSNNLKESYAYSYFQEAVTKKIEHLKSIGISELIANLLLKSIDIETSGAIWAEENNTIMGCLCFGLKKLDNKIMTVNLLYSHTGIESMLNEKLEQYANELDCFYIEEIVSVMDEGRISSLESIDYKKEFCLMYKRV
jgi:hypothetical protein